MNMAQHNGCEEVQGHLLDHHPLVYQSQAISDNAVRGNVATNGSPHYEVQKPSFVVRLKDGVSLEQIRELCESFEPLEGSHAATVDDIQPPTPGAGPVPHAPTGSPLPDGAIMVAGQEFPPRNDAAPVQLKGVQVEAAGSETVDKPGTCRVPYLCKAGAEADAAVVDHWRAMWREAGVADGQFRADFDTRTRAFIARARDR